MMKIVDDLILFFSRLSPSNSLWKLSTFCGCKGIYSSVCEECEKLGFIQIGHSGNSDSQLKRVAS